MVASGKNMDNKAPKYLIVTYGCQMNKNDSERIASLLSDLGFEPTESDKEADLILINSCSVRKSAEDRVFGRVHDYRKLKEKNPNLIIAVTGCMAGRDKKGEFKAKMGPVDLYFPTSDMVKLPRWISELRPDLVNTTDLKSDYLKIRPLRAPSSQAYVSIQTGCNNFCTYCVVPYARGFESNRPAKDIMDEVKDLAAHGVIEITLLGQTVNSYKAPDPENFSSNNPYVISTAAERSINMSSRPQRRDLSEKISPLHPENFRGSGRNDRGNHFAALLWEVNQISELKRVHWTAPYPSQMSDEVIDALTLPKQVNFLHLPVQSGSNEVLRRMNRKYTREQYLEIINKVKAKRPGIALATDIIVGFSGETEEQFQETVSLFKEVDFDISYNAQYSPRSGTLGIKLYEDDIPAAEKRRRWRVLQELMEETALRKNQEFKDKTVNVLVEKIQDKWASGNTDEMKLCRFPCDDPSLIGKIVPVKVTLVQEWQLMGNIVE